VQVLVDLALLFARRERRDHRTGAHGLDRLDHRLAVVALVRYHRRHLRRGGGRCPPPPGVADVRLLAAAELGRARPPLRSLPAAWILVPQPPRLLPKACSACPPVPSAFFLGRQT